MSGKSNLHGRAFEYLIVKELSDALTSSATLSFGASLDQKRDRPKLRKIEKSVLDSLTACAKHAVVWLEKNLHVLSESGDGLLIDRLPDSAAQEGDVTDIRLKYNGKAVNISAKNEHSAMKHQRPMSVADWCGLGGTRDDFMYRETYRNVVNQFHATRKSDYHAVSTFAEMKFQNTNAMNELLYAPINALVADFLNEKSVGNDARHRLHAFLFGTKSYYKIICHSGAVGVEYWETEGATTLVRAVPVPGRVNCITLEFYDGRTVQLRLHTASTNITKNPSLKYDTQLL